jgi:hypothetical protein
MKYIELIKWLFDSKEYQYNDLISYIQAGKSAKEDIAYHKKLIIYDYLQMDKNGFTYELMYAPYEKGEYDYTDTFYNRLKIDRDDLTKAFINNDFVPAGDEIEVLKNNLIDNFVKDAKTIGYAEYIFIQGLYNKRINQLTNNTGFYHFIANKNDKDFKKHLYINNCPITVDLEKDCSKWIAKMHQANKIDDSLKIYFESENQKALKFVEDKQNITQKTADLLSKRNFNLDFQNQVESVIDNNLYYPGAVLTVAKKVKSDLNLGDIDTLKDLPLLIRASTVKSLIDNNKILIKDIKNLPQYIANHPLAYDSLLEEKAKGVVIVLDLKNKDNKSVVLPIHLVKSKDKYIIKETPVLYSPADIKHQLESIQSLDKTIYLNMRTEKWSKDIDIGLEKIIKTNIFDVDLVNSYQENYNTELSDETLAKTTYPTASTINQQNGPNIAL